MKSILLLVGVYFLLSSCASNSKGDIHDDDAKWLEEQLRGVSNDDFKPKRKIRYNDRFDYHEIGDLVQDALSDESLQKISQGNLDPKDKLSKIVYLCYQGDFDNAFKHSAAVYDNYKTNPSYWNQIGSCYYLQRNLKKAKVFYRRALMLDKKFIPSINNLGVVYLLESKDKKAQAAFEQALILDRTAKTPKFNLANLYIRYGLLDKAETFLRNLKRGINIRDKDIYLSMAYVDLFRGNGSGAISNLNKLDDSVLRSKKGGLALFFAYKLLKSDKANSIANYLESSGLNTRERDVYEKIKNL